MSTNEVLFENEANENAQIISRYPITHDDCITILKVIGEVKWMSRLTGERIVNDIKNLYSEHLR